MVACRFVFAGPWPAMTHTKRLGSVGVEGNDELRGDKFFYRLELRRHIELM